MLPIFLDSLKIGATNTEIVPIAERSEAYATDNGTDTYNKTSASWGG